MTSEPWAPGAFSASERCAEAFRSRWPSESQGRPRCMCTRPSLALCRKVRAARRAFRASGRLPDAARPKGSCSQLHGLLFPHWDLARLCGGSPLAVAALGLRRPSIRRWMVAKVLALSRGVLALASRQCGPTHRWDMLLGAALVAFGGRSLFVARQPEVEVVDSGRAAMRRSALAALRRPRGPLRNQDATSGARARRLGPSGVGAQPPNTIPRSSRTRGPHVRGGKQRIRHR